MQGTSNKTNADGTGGNSQLSWETYGRNRGGHMKRTYDCGWDKNRKKKIPFCE